MWWFPGNGPGLEKGLSEGLNLGLDQRPKESAHHWWVLHTATWLAFLLSLIVRKPLSATRAGVECSSSHESFNSNYFQEIRLRTKNK